MLIEKIHRYNNLKGDTVMPTTMDKDGNATVTCDCGKPITFVDKYGMFCEDLCGYEESIKAEKILTAMIEGIFGK